jgi:hypothetical protein
MSNREFSVLLLAGLSSLFAVQSLHGMALDYDTSASALAEAGWYDGLSGDLLAWPVEDAQEAVNGPSRAQAQWRQITYAGKFDIDISTSAQTDPNLIVLTSKLSGSYRFEAGSDLFAYFYQEAGCSLGGTVQIEEFPAGTPCSLHFEATWPQDTWTGGYFWRFAAESQVDAMECGWDEQGPYGPRFGHITAFAGEPVHVFLATLGQGYAEIGLRNALGAGSIQLDLKLTATRHVADLNQDGYVNFGDLAAMGRQWRRTDPNEAQAAQREAADFDHSGMVDANDLDYLTRHWLLSPRPGLPPEKRAQ